MAELTRRLEAFAIHAADDTHGNNNNGNNVIQGVDPGYYQGQMGAPSRPPSRSNNRSPLSKLVDLTAEGASVPIQGMSIQEREDAELQQAIAASVATSNIQSPQPPQESGIMEADISQPHFGPANRSDYNQNEWAMVTMSRAREDPEPARRKREPGVPAFLRCAMEGAWDKHRLGAIITILHSIPETRNTLLQVGEPPQNGYGHDAEWWKGKTIARPVELQPGDDPSWVSEPKAVWHEELHRLLAFLDATERSYGNADMLAATQPEGTYSSHDPEKDFFDYMSYGEDCMERFKPFMSRAEIHYMKDIDDPDVRPNVNTWGMLELNHNREQLMGADTLYNLLDTIFYADIMNGIEDESQARLAWMTDPAEVMTIRFNGPEGLPKAIGIPQVFYLDRYLASNRDKILNILHNVWGCHENMRRCDQKEKRIKRMWNKDTGETICEDGIALAEAGIANMKRKIGDIRRNAQWIAHNEKAKRTGREGDYIPNLDIYDHDFPIDYTDDERKIVNFYWSRIKTVERMVKKARYQLEGKCCGAVGLGVITANMMQ